MRCTNCGETVQVGARVSQRRVEAPSRDLLAAWIDDGRSTATDTAFRAIAVVTLVGGSLMALLANLPRPERRADGPGGCPASTTTPTDEPVVMDSSGEW